MYIGSEASNNGKQSSCFKYQAGYYIVRFPKVQGSRNALTPQSHLFHSHAGLITLQLLICAYAMCWFVFKSASNLPTLTFLGSLSALENGKNRNMCDIKPKHGKTVGMDPEKKSSHGAPIADISRFSTVVLECDPSSACYSSCQVGTLELKPQ